MRDDSVSGRLCIVFPDCPSMFGIMQAGAMNQYFYSILLVIFPYFLVMPPTIAE
jgi:hypothetical protein